LLHLVGINSFECMKMHGLTNPKVCIVAMLLPLNIKKSVSVTLYPLQTQYYNKGAYSMVVSQSVTSKVRCKVIHLHQIGILTFNYLLKQTKTHSKKTKIRAVPTVLIGGLIKDFNY